MFVRIKKSTSRQNTAVQLVEGVRDPITNKVKQTVVRHIGSGVDEAEIAKLVELGELSTDNYNYRRPTTIITDFMAQKTQLYFTFLSSICALA